MRLLKSAKCLFGWPASRVPILVWSGLLLCDADTARLPRWYGWGGRIWQRGVLWKRHFIIGSGAIETFARCCTISTLKQSMQIYNIIALNDNDGDLARRVIAQLGTVLEGRRSQRFPPVFSFQHESDYAYEERRLYDRHHGPGYSKCRSGGKGQHTTHIRSVCALGKDAVYELLDSSR